MAFTEYAKSGKDSGYTFYLYRVTSTKDSGYYIGRRSLKKAKASVKDCLEDEYMGSGGVKYKNWVKKVEKESLGKEILLITESFEEVVAAEEFAVGTLHKTDFNCKNTVKGGLFQNSVGWSELIHFEECSVHGVVKHGAQGCMSCHVNSLSEESLCSIHGLTNFNGGECSKCSVQKSITTKRCSIHFETLHIGNSCFKCFINKQWSEDVCSIHGVTKFHGVNCMRCVVREQYSQKECSVHGVTLHRGSVCSSCNSIDSVRLKECFIHGETKFRGSKCCKCSSLKAYHTKRHVKLQVVVEDCSYCS